jgi:hypothetical protein
MSHLFVVRIPKRASLLGSEISESGGQQEVQVDIASMLRDRLEQAKIRATWLPEGGPGSGPQGYCVMFRCLGSQSEQVLAVLTALGIGSTDNPEFGSIDVLPIEIAKPLPTSSAKDTITTPGGSDFTDTVTSRLLVEQLVSQINQQAALSFDFIVLAIVASVLAGVGLGSNNTVVVVASMLVSPIMGPIMQLTFGSAWE